MSLNTENSEKFSYSARGMVPRCKERQTKPSRYEKVPLQGTVLNILLKYVKLMPYIWNNYLVENSLSKR